jgi:hypothetical protein
VLVGGAGSDHLTGGTGINLLIADGGADVLTAGPKSDLLIGGSTDFDANVAALSAIMAEWTSSDSYTTKVARLMGTQSGGANGTTVLTSATVHNNNLASTLTGGAGLDWFWSSNMDVINAKRTSETVTSIT